MRRLALLALILVAATARAQSVIDPGMTRAQVVEKLGKPLAERTSGSLTYLFYRNGVERRAGMNDLVVLEQDKVVDAVFRDANHKFSGKSSSPAEVTAAAARAEGRKARDAAGPAEKLVPASATAKTAAPAAKKLLPAEEAQQAEVAKPMPPAKSPARDAAKAAEAAATAAATAAKAAAADPKAAPATKAPDPKAPDPKAPSTKKP